MEPGVQETGSLDLMIRPENDVLDLNLSELAFLPQSRIIMFHSGLEFNSLNMQLFFILFILVFRELAVFYQFLKAFE